MRHFFLTLVLVSVFCHCSRDKKYDPDSQLSPQEKDKIMMTLIRYVAKAPENVNESEKFSDKYDLYYQERASQTKLEQYYVEGKQQYFLISQPAPSLVEKRHATGGKMLFDDTGNLLEYEEVFRTWKLIPDTLKRRSYFLFDKMVKGEPLTSYLTKNSSIEYIEFPDDNTFYDKTARRWKSK
jgi:hypothetical protein